MYLFYFSILILKTPSCVDFCRYLIQKAFSLGFLLLFKIHFWLFSTQYYYYISSAERHIGHLCIGSQEINSKWNPQFIYTGVLFSQSFWNIIVKSRIEKLSFSSNSNHIFVCLSFKLRWIQWKINWLDFITRIFQFPNWKLTSILCIHYVMLC